MAHEKMQLAVPRVNNDVLGIQLGGTDSMPRKYQKKKHCKSFSEVHRVLPLACTNSDDRFPVLTFLTVESNGLWRIVSVPVPYSDSEPLGTGTDTILRRKRVAQETSDTTNSPPIIVSTENRQNKASNRTVWKELPKNLTAASTKPCVQKNEPTAKRSHGKKNKKKPKRGKKSPDSMSGTRDSDDGDQKEMPNRCSSQVLELVPVLHPISNHGTKTCHGSKRREKENAKAEHLPGPKGSSGCRRSPCNVVDSCNNKSPDKTGPVHHSSNGKEDHSATFNRIVQNQTSSQVPNFNGNRSARAVWQKVQKNSADDDSGDPNRVSAPLQSSSDDLEQAKQLKRSGSDSNEECSLCSEIGCATETVVSGSSGVTVPPGVTTRDSKRSDSNRSLLQSSSPEFIPDLFGNSVRQALERIYLADCGAQKWMPIGLKDLGLESCADRSLPKSAVKSQPRKDAIIKTVQTVDQQEKGSTQNDKSLCSDKENGVSAVTESALDKVAEAVNRAYELQLESEAIEKSWGRPLAEFERLLQKSCPVIHQPQEIQSSPEIVCSRGTLLCEHERPDSPLSSIWEWYEELGVCGLEVNGIEYERTKRFSAYFVPYLSAVQLFRNTVSCPQVDFDSERSSVENEPELLFEYFESEPPQQRRTLYAKIRQLVNGDGPPQYQGQGDPANLDRAKLNKLHPKSWYSVAWYPIYRIPEGNFRASFLTFHSLGHFTRRSSGFNSNGAQDCIVCPALGLQSYNAQSECWYSLRSSVEETAWDINGHEILKERVRSLEETASVMARATVKKANQNSVNLHPDFEFFFSRKRSW